MTSTITTASAALGAARARNARNSSGVASLVLLLAALLLNSSCNGVLVCRSGPSAGELNWAGRAFCKVGLFTDRLGVTAPVMLEDAEPANSSDLNPETCNPSPL